MSLNQHLPIIAIAGGLVVFLVVIIVWNDGLVNSVNAASCDELFEMIEENLDEYYIGKWIVKECYK